MPPTKNRRSHSAQSDKVHVPGVQKIKSSIRQATRLLAKDKLAADVRIETERRLKALQSDLDQAMRSRLERKMAVKYHKIKFFERQKALRKIHSAKRQLEDESLQSKARRQVEKSLLEHRVDLNYILHFPKTRKYVSLFPSSTDTNDQGEATPTIPEPSGTSKVRQEMRDWVRSAMKDGDLEAEPENSLGEHEAAQKFPPTFDFLEGDEMDESEAEEVDLPLTLKAGSGASSESNTKSRSRNTGKSQKKAKGRHAPAATENLTLAGDDFFGSD